MVAIGRANLSDSRRRVGGGGAGRHALDLGFHPRVVDSFGLIHCRLLLPLAAVALNVLSSGCTLPPSPQIALLPPTEMAHPPRPVRGSPPQHVQHRSAPKAALPATTPPQAEEPAPRAERQLPQEEEQLPQVTATDDEKDMAETALTSCLANAAKRHDDRRSDLISVAVDVRSRCRDDFLRYVGTYTRGMDLEARENTKNEVVHEELGLAASAVFRNRVIASINGAADEQGSQQDSQSHP